MTLAHSFAERGEVGRFTGDAMIGLFLQSGSRWQDATEPLWKPEEIPAWFDVELPFQRQGTTMTLVQVRSRIGEPQPLVDGDAAAKLRAFDGWLDSLPLVPHIPLESLDRSNLY